MNPFARRIRTQSVLLAVVSTGALLAVPNDAAAQIDVYFTRPVDTTLASSDGNRARYEPDVARLVARLLAGARHSIDIAMYNLNVQPVVDALIAAHRRGVTIRLVANVENLSNPTSRFQQLAAIGIPIATNPRAPSGEQQPLMHDKFIVIDGRPGERDSVPTVITGSWNATVAQTYEDANNVVVIRDSAVAGAYRAELEEMWGSAGDAPDPSRARFGAAKRDNTDHQFTLSDGTLVELWFSPSDAVESRIRSAISTAGTSLYMANLTITSSALANEANVRRARIGADVRVLVENVGDQGSQFGFLRDAVDAHSTASVPGQLHHKYAIVDAVPVGAGSQPRVVTGSHNWTFSANSVNDENTLVIHSDRIANQFLQEFAARYREAGGMRGFGVASVALDGSDPLRLLPNPFTSSLVLSEPLPCPTHTTVVDALGRVVLRRDLSAGERSIDVSAMTRSPGTYIATIVTCDGDISTHRLVRVR